MRVAWLLLGGLLVLPARADRATLKVRVGEPGVRVSPMLYGIFFEEINHAGDGGLYAELVRNRSFEDAAEPEGWVPVQEGGASCALTLDRSQPLNDRNPTALRLEITAQGGGRAGVANGGYWGIAVRSGETYRLTLHARRDPAWRGSLDVSLEGAAGQVYARGRIGGLTTRWRRLDCSLRCNAADPAARLVIAASSSGTVWLDSVSLFPPTWKARPNGLRRDLAQMLADLKPAFVRFPGGCFCEGDRLANAFRWKETIGDVALRPGHWNLWGYRSSDGLGYHEYLQMCEDLGAEPLFVINCGMAHADVVPLDQMQEWVQDALDAIEYANGPITSRWGAQRARNGHPKPFGLKYLEIGNENGGPAYEERYALFWDAVKQHYPEIQLIANVRVTSRPMDIVDEHYYSSPEWFSGAARRYDRADRQGPRIYVGEYAVTQGCGQGNLRAALAEAAFMTGLERNSDIVVMASYAPLFVNINDRTWNPDAICFNSASVCGTPSYQVQKLFAHHRADTILPLELGTETPAQVSKGAIGLATWATQAEFTEVRVTAPDGAQLFAADFAEGAQGWRSEPGEQGRQGEWTVEGGAYRQASDALGARAVAGDPAWQDYTLSLKARKLGGAEGFLIMFRVRDQSNWFWWNLGGWGNVRHAIEQCVNGGKSILGDGVPGSIETGRWYDIRIELQGPRIRCYLDGQLIHDVEEATPQPLAAVAGRDETTGEIILKVVNTSGSAQDTEVVLEGVGRVAPAGKAIILTAESPEEENSLAQPLRVAPVETRISGIGPTFRHTFPPYSLTILRVGAAGSRK